MYHSAYRPHTVESKEKKKKKKPLIANSTLSACVESIIGAAYLMGGETVLYFLEKFELLDGLDPCLSSTATRCCLKSGYPFDNDQGGWQESLEKVAGTLHKEHKIEQELLEGVICFSIFFVQTNHVLSKNTFDYLGQSSCYNVLSSTMTWKTRRCSL